MESISTSMTHAIGTMKGTAMKHATPFRLWVQEIWYQNRAEHEEYGELPYSLQEYWHRYKYWLKREYQYKKGIRHV
jgi:hypothetical protein